MVAPIEHLGLSPIHLNCLNGDLEKVVATIQSHPQSLEETTPEGTTPLMLASLMGHYDIVKFLVVVKSANVHKENANRLKAADFAHGNDHTNLVRTEYVEAGLGKENALGNLNRKEILGLLESPARRTILKNQHRRGGDLKYHDYKLAKIGTKIGVYGLVGMVDTGMPLTRNKTIGMIMPEGDDLPILSVFDFAEHAEDGVVPGPTFYATSGWKKDDGRAPQVVDSELWCSVAHQLASVRVGHKFKTGQRDNGALPPTERQKGRGAACHVEVLLSTMYAFSLAGARLESRPGQSEEERIEEQVLCLEKVQEMNLGKRRYMVIYIDSHPCKSCIEYVTAMGDLTGIWFRIRSGCGMGPPLRLGGNRRDVYGEVWEDEDAQGAEVEAAMRADPALMDGHRYRSERDASLSMSPEQMEHDGTPPLEDDDDDDEDLPDAAILFTPPPETPQAVSAEKQLAFRDHINKFAFQAQVKRNIPRVQRRPRYAPYIVPNPLDFKPFPPTPVLNDPFVDRTSPESSNDTVADAMGVDEEEGDYSYSDLQFRKR
ncbi:hypothetical protein PG985_009942 [Apiospora marii]|uniref:CMP/dCMP-type deaminase domain-containing protein n=1 Tax=Apiospora marii TaxID=335849 RepID=A0ABR1RRV9_9PEZI